MRFDIVQNDTDPIGQQLTDPNSPNGLAPLVGTEAVTFAMVQADGTKTVHGSAVIDNPDEATVHYAWALGDTSVPGVYRAQWHVVYSGGVRLTYPSDEPLYVVILPSL